MEWTEKRISTYRVWALIALVVVSLVGAWHNRFIQDDAFISFVYARDLVENGRLTWFGTRVEGYTNFLWVLWVAGGMALGIDPILWTYVGGLASFAAAIYGLWRLSFSAFRAYVPSVLVVLLFTSNYSISCYATGGLETMLQTALLCWSMVLGYEVNWNGAVRVGRCAALSVLLAAAVLTRMDSALPGLVVGVLGLVGLCRKGVSWRHCAALTGPFVLMVGAWLLWKLWYYGTILPNSYYAKVGWSISLNRNGLVYLWRFVHWYLLWPFLAGGGLILVFKRGLANGRVVPLVAVVLAWCGYIVYVGGDFMEFRFLVPISPFLAILLGYLIYDVIGQGLAGHPMITSLICLSILIGASVHHSRTFTGFAEGKTLDSITMLSTFYEVYPQGDFSTIGKGLRSELAGTGAVLASTAAGAVPYYSGLKTIDMWGLNDLHISRHGTKVPTWHRRPGHRRHATLRYLREQNVNLVIGHPTVVYRGRLNDPRAAPGVQAWIRQVIEVKPEPIREAVVVAMPLDRDSALLMWYLTRKKEIDDVMIRNGWEVLRLREP